MKPIALLAGALSVAAAAIALLLPVPPLFAFALTVALMVPATWMAIRAYLRPVLSLFHALEGTVASYRDGDFSCSLHWKRRDELASLVDAHNALGNVLRDQRLGLAQRELLLDTMVQNTPVAMLLVADGGAIVYANIAARQLLNQGRSLEGHRLPAILEHAAAALTEALARGGDGLFSTGEGDEEEVYHLARRSFTLNGRKHELLLLRQLTSELRRQEVQTWKKVIRVISHELNNSLAPLSSLAHSGAELIRRGQTERLPQILDTISERTAHLESFIQGYARFAMLPAPQVEAVGWDGFVARLAAQERFTVAGSLPALPARFDPAQLEQALVNLLRNAHESGSRDEDVELRVKAGGASLRIEVRDRGPGMSGAVLTNALVPFYSTKRHGTGLGLALAREIAEAHGGRITLGNREGGGLAVTLILPA